MVDTPVPGGFGRGRIIADDNQRDPSETSNGGNFKLKRGNNGEKEDDGGINAN